MWLFYITFPGNSQSQEQIIAELKEGNWRQTWCEGHDKTRATAASRSATFPQTSPGPPWMGPGPFPATYQLYGLLDSMDGEGLLGQEVKNAVAVHSLLPAFEQQAVATRNGQGCHLRTRGKTRRSAWRRCLHCCVSISPSPASKSMKNSLYPIL